jgi:hypothetical protein
MNIQTLDKLYLRYGYTLNKKLSNDKIRVYTLNKGVYFGADIITNNEDEDCQNIIKQLSDGGYACRLKVFIKIEQAEKFLFESFFHSTQLSERLQNRYKHFTQNQSDILKVKYEYIPVSYLLENEGFKPNISIIESVTSKLTSSGAQLIIIEAAAGYGKTCTSYELINKVSLDIKSLSPIFTELSRDRRAAIFKHILQDVIVNEFHSLLDEELVIHEIQSGKIPLIIDGFDELLSKEQDTGSSEFEQVETMLSTIGDLLINNAKIIITGRKTAIFSGDSFINWIDSNPNEFSVNRYLLNPPKIKDWLNQSKLEKILEKNIPINQISNPVLLAFLRSLNDGDFDLAVKTPSKIVERYFETILDREQERQQLNIEGEEQLNIFRKLTEGMIEFDITSDTKTWIKELIVDRNFDLLEKIRKSYSISTRPSLDELTNTLSNHALLDRKGNKDNIGFINDFIFGTFIGENLLRADFNVNKVVSKHMIELAITAFQFQTEKKKNDLYEKVSILKFFLKQDSFLTEYQLKGIVSQIFENATFNDFSISKLEFEIEKQFSRCVFANCTFENVTFNNKAFFETTFVNCVFHECNFINSSDYINISLINCNDYGCGFLELASNNLLVNENKDNTSYSDKILIKFLDTSNRPRHRKISNIINDGKADERIILSRIINKFKTNKWIKVNGDNAFLTEIGIQEVKKMVK